MYQCTWNSQLTLVRIIFTYGLFTGLLTNSAVLYHNWQICKTSEWWINEWRLRESCKYLLRQLFSWHAMNVQNNLCMDTFATTEFLLHCKVITYQLQYQIEVSPQYQRKELQYQKHRHLFQAMLPVVWYHYNQCCPGVETSLLQGQMV